MSAARNPALQELLDAMIDGIAQHAAPDSDAGKALARVRAAAGTPGEQGVSEPTEPRPPGHACLAEALTAAKSNGGYAARAAAALEKLEPQITWYRREGLTPEQAEFPDRHALASLIGPADRSGSLEVRGDLRVGVSLVAPGIMYPDHHHPPEELYLALTAGEWRQDRGPWFSPGPNGIVYNTPNILHGMRATDEPQLAVWALPVP